MSDIERWSTWSKLGLWPERIKLAAEWIPRASTVLDLGCGDMSLERHLVDCCYIPCDVVKRDGRTIVCDLNAARPRVPVHPTHIVALGLLEYITDPPALVEFFGQARCAVITSYHPTDLDTTTFRSAEGWLNALSLHDIILMFNNAGMTLTHRRPVNTSQELYKFEVRS